MNTNNNFKPARGRFTQKTMLIKIPAKYLELVGTKQTFQGGIFSRKVALPPTEFDVLEIRQGLATIMNVKEMKEKGYSSTEYPTFELLLKNSTMKRARWSNPFPIREINLKSRAVAV